LRLFSQLEYTQDSATCRRELVELAIISSTHPVMLLSRERRAFPRPPLIQSKAQPKSAFDFLWSVRGKFGLIDDDTQSDWRLIVESGKILSTTGFGLPDTSDAAVMVSTRRCMAYPLSYRKRSSPG